MALMRETDLLVVDDDAEFRDILVRRFEGKFKIASAPDAEQALSLAQRREFDVALFDMRLPGMSGLQLLERFKAEHPGCEVLLLTGQGSIESAVEAMKLGACDYLTKPFPLRELEVHIEKAVERSRLRK